MNNALIGEARITGWRAQNIGMDQRQATTCGAVMLRPPRNKDQKEVTMKKPLFLSVAMLGLLMTLAVVSVHAQSRSKIEVTIPFDFTAGKVKLEAGTYSVKFISHNALLLRSADGKQSAIIVAPRTVGWDKKPERVVFHRYGDRYFLSQVWMLRTDSGRELDPSSAELSLAKEIAKSNAQPPKVEIAATRK
ncbi:MAG: hypothetical protein ACR2HX_07385 [Pyrinomonadaceae bacterium]